MLGFTRGEIGYILLGELALLTLAAIPVGFLVGVGLVGILVLAFESELYRLLLILTPENYAMGASVVIVSALSPVCCYGCAWAGWIWWRCSKLENKG